MYFLIQGNPFLSTYSAFSLSASSLVCSGSKLFPIGFTLDSSLSISIASVSDSYPSPSFSSPSPSVSSPSFSSFFSSLSSDLADFSFISSSSSSSSSSSTILFSCIMYGLFTTKEYSKGSFNSSMSISPSSSNMLGT